MFGQGGLSRQKREMIALAVSGDNRREYCVAHHSAALREYARDEPLVTQLADSPESAQLEPREKAIAAYALKLTRHPAGMTEAHLESIRRVKLSDEEILQLTLIAS
jgi:uncharacterized peroxidase-related enzyme